MASFVKLRRRYEELGGGHASLVCECGCRLEDATAQRVIGSNVVVSLLGRNRQAAVTANHGPSLVGSMHAPRGGAKAVADLC